MVFSYPDRKKLIFYAARGKVEISLERAIKASYRTETGFIGNVGCVFAALKQGVRYYYASLIYVLSDIHFSIFRKCPT